MQHTQLDAICSTFRLYRQGPGQLADSRKHLQRELEMIEASHGNEVLNLVLARGYLGKLFGNARIVRYLGQHHCDIFRELQAILDVASLEP